MPVGATNLMCNLQSNNSCRTSNKRVTVVVFPVPGPPVIIENGLLIAVATATFANLFSCFSGNISLIFDEFHHKKRLKCGVFKVFLYIARYDIHLAKYDRNTTRQIEIPLVQFD